ncbi:MAG: glycosyltransferase [Gammaproteobacteria bacterium]|nr:glycosyltransferase [Gammaproteobacteria bacterium]
MSTYNGATFLDALLASLAVQWRDGDYVLVRDDGSSDDTVRKVEAWRQHHPGRIRWAPDSGEHLGVVGSFGRLLALALAAEPASGVYFLFCDQDDVWLPGKRDVMVACLTQEEVLTPDGAVLVHSDLTVVDYELNVVANSFWDYQGVVAQNNSVIELMFGNTVTGCACGMTRPLAARALPMPPQAVMHDAWLALVAALCGRIVPLAIPTVLYRQHDGNALGAVDKRLRTDEGLSWRQYGAKVWRHYAAIQRMAGALLTLFPDDVRERLGGIRFGLLRIVALNPVGAWLIWRGWRTLRFWLRGKVHANA